MRLRRLWLTDFRGYETADVAFDGDLTAVLGPNGHGKTNLLEAIGYLATLESFRGAPVDALIRVGADRAIVRAEGEREGRQLLLEAEIVRNGRNRTMLNRQPLRRARDLLGALRVTVFAPDDLILVKGGPGERRRYLDDTLVALHPRFDQIRGDLDKILRQRGALLKGSGGRLTDEVELTLDVFDAKLTEVGECLVRARIKLTEELEPVLEEAYRQVSRSAVRISLRHDPPWMATGLADALRTTRRDDLRRGVTTVGPHRDDLDIDLDGMPARTHASQGEQRCLALALRLGSHEVVTRRTDSAPILLLDDVFSELDPDRSAALLESLPDGQTILSTAGPLPEGAVPGRILAVREGTVAPVVD